LWFATAAAIAWIWSIVDGQYTVLNSRLETVSTNVNLSRQGAVETAVARLAPDTTRLAQQVAQAEAALAQLRRQVEDAQSQVAQAQTGATQAQAAAVEAQRQGAELQTQATQSTAQLRADVERDLSALAAKAADAQKGGDDARAQAAQLLERLTQLGTQLTQARTGGEQAQAQVSQLQGQLAQLQTQIGEARTGSERQVAQIGTQLGQLQTQVTQLSQLQAQVAQLATQVGQVQAQAGNTRDIGDRLAAAEAGVNASRQQLERRTEILAAEVEELKRAIQATDTAVLQRQIRDADGQVAQIRTALVEIGPSAEIVQRLAAVLDRIRESDARTAAAQERTEQLERELGQIRAALTAAAPRAEVTQVLGDLSSKLRSAETNPDQVSRNIATLNAEFERIRRLTEAAGTGSGGPVCSAAGTLPLVVYFDVNSSRLDDTDRGNLSGLVRSMETPSAVGCRLMIYGYADQQGRSTSNQALSLRRAVAVRNQLLESGLDETRIVTVVGLGAEATAIQRAARSAAAREQDRRVVISIVR
jgi:outer membrane protein OmpA-like peptidoglycan-associated protein